MNPDIFDAWTEPAGEQASSQSPKPAIPADDALVIPATPQLLRRALQQLLRDGVLEAAARPQLFKELVRDTQRSNTLLEPFDLELRVDDARGLVFVAVAASYLPEGEDEADQWTHPLVRRLPLTLEQSLLLAILRREFLQREQESGLGVPVQVTVDSLLPQLEIYLGATGSDTQDRKRLGHLLDKLYEHGVVSRTDAQERLSIRPMIVHLANPDNLQSLLAHMQQLTGNTP